MCFHRSSVDIDNKGSMSKERFAVLMYLVRMKVQDEDLPRPLPYSLIPPSMRHSTDDPELLELMDELMNSWRSEDIRLVTKRRDSAS